MAQASANREPTMEEILASIRRIIESNDAGDSDAGQRDPESGMEPAITAGSVLDDLTASNDDDRGEPADAGETADRVEDDEICADTPAATADHDSFAVAAVQPVSLADVAARVRSSGAAAVLAKGGSASVSSLSTRGSAAVRVEPDFGYAEDEADEEAEALPASALRSTEIPEPDVDLDLDELSADLAGLAPQSVEQSVSEAPEYHEERANGQAVAHSSDPSPGTSPESADGEIEEGNHLMSPQAGAKVTAAFDDLKEMMAEGACRSFDEIAEEMLRPMLQQWLDDNLPTLVERLVREEIERVARGSRR